jgi:hypothetical protein
LTEHGDPRRIDKIELRQVLYSPLILPTPMHALRVM